MECRCWIGCYLVDSIGHIYCIHWGERCPSCIVRNVVVVIIIDIIIGSGANRSEMGRYQQICSLTYCGIYKLRGFRAITITIVVSVVVAVIIIIIAVVVDRGSSFQ